MKEFRSFTSDFDSEMRGLAISNSETIRTVHNSFARSDPFFHDDKDDENDKRDREDAFHFTAFVPVNGKLYELDGLKPYPVCFGDCDPAHWLDKATPIIMERIQKYSGGEIRFSLMAVIKNRQVVYQQEKDRLQTELSKAKDDEKKAGHLKASIQRIETQIKREQEKMENHKVSVVKVILGIYIYIYIYTLNPILYIEGKCQASIQLSSIYCGSVQMHGRKGRTCKCL